MAEVKNAVKSLKDGKAAGLTGITAEHFKWLGIEGAEWLTMLMKKNYGRENSSCGLD